jgi:GGDEF domain-containing protein
MVTDERYTMQAGEVAKRLRGRIVQRGFGSDELRPLSAAIGFAMFPADGRSVDELLSVADADLFAAKPGERRARDLT